MGLVEIIEPRRRTRAHRLAFTPQVVCPAGQAIYETREGKGAGCRCFAEQSVLTATSDAGSLSNFCFAGYSLCPSWQRLKEWVWLGHRSEMTDPKHDEREREENRRIMMEQSRDAQVVSYEAPD